MTTNATPGSRLASRLVRLSPDFLFLAIDAVFTAVSYLLALLLRFGGAVPERDWRHMILFLPLAVAVHLLANAAWGLYRQLWRHASVLEARRLLLAGTASTAWLLCVTRLPWLWMPA